MFRVCISELLFWIYHLLNNNVCLPKPRWQLPEKKKETENLAVRMRTLRSFCVILCNSVLLSRMGTDCAYKWFHRSSFNQSYRSHLKCDMTHWKPLFLMVMEKPLAVALTCSLNRFSFSQSVSNDTMLKKFEVAWRRRANHILFLQKSLGWRTRFYGWIPMLVQKGNAARLNHTLQGPTYFQIST